MSLLDEIYYSGVVDIRVAPTIILLMGLSNADNASDIKLPKNVINSDYMVRTFRYLNLFFGIKFKISEFEETEDESSSDNEEEKPKIVEVPEEVDEEALELSEHVQKAECNSFS
mmetsp:Transcript_27341/g.24224  ORF Transcript_27341/g.24224 Transcript_27341/m.24224 type:complete len:114 (+) Transcript_27341:756-1097(+)